MTDQEILNAICGFFGAATATVANKLVNSSATFVTDGIVAGDLLINRTDATSTIVLAIDSETTLSVRDDIFVSGEEYLIAGHLEKRWRFSKQDNLLDQPPLKEELEETVGSVLGEINAYPPITSWTLSECYEDIVGGRRSLLLYGSAKNVAQLLLNQWLNEGFSGSVGDLSAENKFSDYSSMYSQIESTFNERLEKLKTAKGKYIKRATVSDNTANILSTTHFWGFRW